MSLKDFLWKHRGRVAIAATVVVATGILVYSTLMKKETENDAEEESIVISSTSANDIITDRKLIRIRQQYEKSLNHILPTLKLKVTEVIDVLGTIRQIKELRLNSSARQQNNEREHALWEEIKVTSFVLWFTSIYCTCAIVILLRVQLFILSRNTSGMTISTNDDFQSIVEETYSFIFNTGITKLSDTLRMFISRALSDWTVKDKTSVTYEEFDQIIFKIRHYMEVESGNLPQSIILPTADHGVASENAQSRADDENTVGTSSENSTWLASKEADEATQRKEYDTFLVTHFAELWDVVESPQFSTAFAEACDLCFIKHLNSLRQDLFISFDSRKEPSATTTRVETVAAVTTSSASPALASILPQVKSLAARVLPTEGVGFEVRDISQTQEVEALCLSALRVVKPAASRRK